MGLTNKAIKNTGYLYLRMLISIVLSLWSTRIVLQALGAADFGIFSIVAGVVAMFTFLNAALSVSTQRYLSFYVGKGDLDKLQEIFSVSVILHFLLGLLVLLLMESLSFLFLTSVLNIEQERFSAADAVFHFTIVGTFFTINSVPYDAAINANEDIYFDAITGVIEAIMRLVAAFVVSSTPHDGLIVYGLLTMGITILIRIMKSVFCHYKYPELRVNLRSIRNRRLFREILSFSSWNLFGSLSSLIKIQGIAIILNIFFGTVTNAAYALANQVSTQLTAFSENMLKAVRPQIIKSEGSGDREGMLKLTFVSSKFAYLILSVFAIPVIINMELVLKIWLTSFPAETVNFARLAVVISLLNLYTIGIRTAVQATGRIKRYQAIVGGLLIFNLPLAYAVLEMGFDPASVYLTSIFIELVAMWFRIRFLSMLTGITVLRYYTEVIGRSSLPALTALAIYLPIRVICDIKCNDIYDFVLFFTVFIMLYFPLILILGFSKSEFSLVRQKFFKVFKIC